MIVSTGPNFERLRQRGRDLLGHRFELRDYSLGPATLLAATFSFRRDFCFCVHRHGRVSRVNPVHVETRFLILLVNIEVDKVVYFNADGLRIGRTSLCLPITQCQRLLLDELRTETDRGYEIF